ncbi:YciI family protein [Pseudooceanicola nanhaiensis]|uniref:YciI family protein n=1 Tax=Pseudooceanicola nanhaiensis TaxID=375761 RepID=UPI001CD5E92F|nr:YciI family protein [Pseudooceanicola nanhaiensis]MCA0920528.1 YciI family protein [Pseudooceanicola nanhaiensis]
MPHFLYIYRGDTSQIPTTPEEQQAAMAAWGVWMAGLGAALIDPGNPVGKSSFVSETGVSPEVPNPSFGYSIVEAPDLATACEMATGNPMVTGSGGVEVAQIIPM